MILVFFEVALLEFLFVNLLPKAVSTTVQLLSILFGLIFGQVDAILKLLEEFHRTFEVSFLEDEQDFFLRDKAFMVAEDALQELELGRLSDLLISQLFDVASSCQSVLLLLWCDPSLFVRHRHE